MAHTHPHSLKSAVRRRARGVSMVEYALLLVAILIIAAAGFKTLGKNVRMGADKATTTLTSR